MNIGTITKVIMNRSAATATTPILAALLRKQPLCRLSSCMSYFHHLPKTSTPSLHPRLQPQNGKPALYRGISSTQKNPWTSQTMASEKASVVNIWEDLKEIRSAPLPALILGFSGLVPFVLPPAYMIFTQTFIPNLAFAQNSFGTCILAFLGGVRWGFIVPEGSPLKADWFNFGYSMLPILMAWASLMASRHTTATLILMAGIACAAYFDMALKGYPPWFKGLRFVLSMGILLAMWSVLMCKVTLLPPSKIESEDHVANMVASTMSLRADSRVDSYKEESELHETDE